MIFIVILLGFMLYFLSIFLIKDINFFWIIWIGEMFIVIVILYVFSCLVNFIVFFIVIKFILIIKFDFFVNLINFCGLIFENLGLF